MMEPRSRSAIALVLFAMFVVTLDVRDPTFEEALAEGSWVEGTVAVRGIVDDAHVVQTPDGELHTVSLRYAWYDWPFIWLSTLGGPGLVGDLSEMGDLVVAAPQELGSRLRMDVHFEAFMLDGTSVVSPREAVCLYPCLHVAMADVMDDVSEAQGMELRLVGTGEWATYAIQGSSIAPVDLDEVWGRIVSFDRGDSIEFPPQGGSVGGYSQREIGAATAPFDSLEDWMVLAAADFVTLSDLTGFEDGGGFPMPLAGLEDWLVVGDQNRDGQLGEGDHVRVKYPGGTSTDRATYVVQLFSCLPEEDQDCLLATKLALVDAGVAYEWQFED